MSDAPFEEGDIVRTTKGARFWGKVISVKSVRKEYELIGRGDLLVGPTEWRVDVFAIHPEFYGTIHIYPASQLEEKIE